MEKQVDEDKTSSRGGLWYWILFLMSSIFAMPNSILEIGSPYSKNLNSWFSLKWTNPFRWMPSFSILQGDSVSTARPVTTFLNTVELAEHYGYAAERHKVTTEDGYILEIHRLPSGKVPSPGDAMVSKPRPVVLIHHAFLTCSREFLLLGPQKSLAFVLADAGYDVWLCNARGNTYSRRHTTMEPTAEEFWDFSYHEHGTLDLPAVINYVLRKSGREQLHYVGHSMGTAVLFVMASERPEMLEKLKTFTAMGAITSASRCRSKMLQFFMRTAKWAVVVMRWCRMYEFLRHYRWFTRAGQTVCNNGRFAQIHPIKFIINPLCGKSTSFNTDVVPEMLAHTPAGSSVKTFAHFAQGYHTGFRKFDYGEKKNLEYYNSKVPPSYDLQAMKVPTQLLYSMNDLMADYTESEYLSKTLPNVFNCVKVPDDTFTHLDFIWSEKAHTLLYPKILEGIKKFED